MFIDEIHRLSPVVEEYLYSAMEDYRIDIVIDKGLVLRSIQIDLNPLLLLVLLRSGLLTSPLERDSVLIAILSTMMEILSDIVRRSSKIINVSIDKCLI